MEFSGVTNELSANVLAVIRSVLVAYISPADKELLIKQVLLTTGSEYYRQMFGASSDIFNTKNMLSTVRLDDAQAARLANKLVRNYGLGRDTAAALVSEYYNSLLGSAQHEAFGNALSMQTHPTLTRTLGPKRDCDWCVSKQGSYTNPTPDDFKRHSKCDCVFTVSGYNSRNGVLKNYKKGEAR